MKHNTQEQFELIAKYFELKDALEMNEKLFESIQMTYNVSLSPHPEIFTKLNDYFSENKFDKFTSPSSEVELTDLKKELITNIDDLETFGGKLETFEIKLKRFLQMNKKGIFYDQDIQQIKQMIAKVGEDQDQEVVIEENEDEKSGRDIEKVKVVKGDDDSFEDEQVNFDDIAKTLDEKVKETARALAECLDAEQSKLTDTIKKEVDRELGYVIEAGQDSEFLKKIEINDTKIDKLEVQIREIEKKEKTLKTRLQNFEKYYDESQKAHVPLKKTVEDISQFEWIKKCDRIGNIKRYRSVSCLETYDRKTIILEKLKKPKRVLKTITFMQELYLSKVEDYNFVSKDYGEEKLTLYNKLSTIFKNHEKYKKKEVFDKSVLIDMLDRIPDKEVRNLISEMWKKNEAIEMADEDPYYETITATEEFGKPTNTFQIAIKGIRDQVLGEISILNECLKEL